MFLYNTFLKPIMFQLDPEKAHHLTISLARLGFSMPVISGIIKKSFQISGQTSLRLMNLDFPNRVGLAAGFDKDGKYLDIMSRLGFGFIEIGTVTPRPQLGNARPRLFRLKADQALINRMGFNNDGVNALIKRLDNFGARSFVLGGNIGKNKDTPNEEAFNDYKICFEALRDRVDYFVVNVSSPNTPGLRALQEKEPLSRILGEVQHLNQNGKVKPRPILLKIAPDITEGQLDDISEIVNACQIEGVVATNTTIDRSNLKCTQDELNTIGAGGLSGRPVKNKSSLILQQIRERLGSDKVIMGVGGIMSGSDAKEKIELGADVVQIYTGLVYSGPSLVKEIAAALSE